MLYIQPSFSNTTPYTILIQYYCNLLISRYCFPNQKHKYFPRELYSCSLYVQVGPSAKLTLGVNFNLVTVQSERAPKRRNLYLFNIRISTFSPVLDFFVPIWTFLSLKNENWIYGIEIKK